MAFLNIYDRLLAVRLMVFDVDGVLTDGGIYLGDQGETKRFDVQDGAGLTIARRAGYHLALITGRESSAVTRRADELKLKHVFQHVKDKVRVLESLCVELDIEKDQVLYMGDDLPDIPMFDLVGLAVAPANAVADAKQRAHHVTTASGGHGAVREIIELVLRNQGTWDTAVAEYIEAHVRLEQ